MAFTKISNSDLVGKQVSELPDIPEMSTIELKARFDALSKEVVIPKHNALVDELEAETGANNIGVEVPEGIESEKKVGALFKKIAAILIEVDNKKHSHENKSILDEITGTVKAAYDKVADLLKNITTVSDTVADDSNLLPTGKAIVSYVQKLGSGDMQAAVYDKNGDGVVDKAEVSEDANALGGESAEVYLRVVSFDSSTGTLVTASGRNE